VIDERAIIDPSAKIGKNVTIGPWSMIGPEVTIGDDTVIGPHVVISKWTSIGRNNKIYQFSSLGEDPQHANYQGEETRLKIGDNNLIREFCTINRATTQGGGETSIGSNNFLMAYVHIAHDCNVGNNVIFVNNASIAGHVTVADYATIGGFCGIHQFCNIGAYSFITAAAMVGKDVPPYVIVTGNTAAVCGLNVVGLKRRGFNSETLTMLRRAYTILFRQGLNVKEAVVQLEQMVLKCPEVQLFIDSINNSNRGLVR
jgi:UDP-N-acetylglucosamine acyltransferase